MTNSNLLRQKIQESGRIMKFIAEKMGISRETLYKKIDNITEFKASEIVKITDILELSDQERNDIFFNENSEL